MKKIIILMLTLALAICMLASCKKECDVHVDENNDGICDVCEEQMPVCEHKDGNEDLICDECGDEIPNYGLILSQTLIDQFSCAKTMKLDFKLNSVTDDLEWYTEDEDTAVQYPYYYDTSTEGTVVFTLDTNGDVCAKIEYKTSERYDAADEYETVNVVVYILGGYVYTYDEALDVYAKDVAESVDVAAITSTLKSLTEGVSIDKAKQNELLTKVGRLVIKNFNIIENKGSLSVDLKDEANDFLGYLAALDLENDTVRGVLDDALALVDDDLTVKALEDEIFRVLGLTVNEAVAEIDAWLTKEHGTTLQGLYDSLISDPTVSQVLKNAIRLQLSESGADDVDAAVEDTFNELKSFNLSQLIEDEGIGEVTLYDLILALTDSAEDAPTLAQLKTQVDATLDMTLAEFDENMLFIPIFSGLKSVGEGTSVNALSAKIDIGFKDLFVLDTLSGSFNMEIESTTPSWVEGKYDESKKTVTASFKLYGISKDITTITVPTDKEIYWDYFDDFFEGSDGYLSTYLGEEAFYLTVAFYEGDNTVYLYATVEDLDVLKSNTITVSPDAIEFDYDGTGKVIYDEEAELVIEIDIANDTFTVISCPEYSVTLTAYDALVAIGTGEGVDESDAYDLDPDFDGYVQDLYGTDDTKHVILLGDSYYIEGILFSFEIDEETGNMLCTITGVFCSGTNGLFDHTMSSAFLGTTYDSTNIDAYYDGDPTFVISLVDGTVYIEGELDVAEAYKANP